MSQVLNQIRFSMSLLKDELRHLQNNLVHTSLQEQNSTDAQSAGAQTNLCGSDRFSLGEVTVTAAIKMFTFTFSLQ